MCCNHFAFSQWYKIYENSFNHSRFLNDIYFKNSNIGYSTNGDSAIAKTTNGGINWLPFVNTSNYNLSSIQFTSNNTGYAIGSDFLNRVGCLMKTTNDGNSWSLTQYSNVTFNSLRFINDNLGYILTDSNFVYKTTNGGVSWLSQSLNGSYLSCFDFINTNNGFVAGSNYKLYVTSNGGINWFQYSAPLIVGLCFVDSLLGYSSAVDGNRGLIYKTSNGGISWNLTYARDSSFFGEPCFVNESTGWIPGSVLKSNFVRYRTMLKTTNGGTAWFEQSTGVQPDSSSCLAKLFMLDANNGFSVTGYCTTNGLGLNPILFRTTNGGGAPIGIFNNGNEIKKFKLNQNYPNPFNPSTIISYTLPFNTFVFIKLYDVIGNEIRLLFKGIAKSGYNELTFNGENYPSGVYFYKIVSDKFSDVKKMILLK